VLRLCILVGCSLVVASSLTEQPLVKASIGVYSVTLGGIVLVWWRTGVDYAIWYITRRPDEAGRKEWLEQAELGNLRAKYRLMILFVALSWIIGGCVMAVSVLREM
jgi:hypothetical protein